VSARESILGAVRAARPPATPLPAVREAVRRFAPPPGDLAERFAEAAVAAGARVLHGARLELPRLVSHIGPTARRVLSLVPDLPGNEPAARDPRDLADLDLLLCEAMLGVAENGAVWLPESRLYTRAALFLAEHVAVVLDRASLVADLHQAYARVDAAAEGFGAFVAGPSKTADIEQALVVGAHGPRGLTIILTT
jgi:L-lactate dehydrogenase complex protein LldG